MALKNLFDMVKADRYTADGREAIIKAQEAETEDKVYQIGEISQKTGLQKTAQGWKPPKETKFGKVKQNKEGQWGVQTKQGKGSDFLKHKSEKEASRALANYTAGYNTTERSKQDPHSDQARQQKQWNKETEKIKKENRAERRAEHAAQFQNQPTLSQTDGKGNKVEIKITESKGGGFYVDKYVNGKKVGINNANTRESAEAKAKSMMEQHMADPDYRAESKPAAESQSESREYRIDEYWKNIRKGTHPVARMAAELDRGTFDDDVRDTMGDGQSMEDLARSLISPAFEDDGYIPQDKLDTARKFILKRYKALESDATDSAPRVLTGDTRIRVRKA